MSCKAPSIGDLTCEGLYSPLGIDSTNPHFSWKVSGNVKSVSAYRIEVASDPSLLESDTPDLWDSGKRPGGESVMVPYEGAGLRQTQECFWRVMVWSEKGRMSPWSEVARFATGILDGFPGEYIGAFEGTDQCPVLCSSFEAPEGAECFVHVNSLGYHELFINGTKVGNAVLVPAVSQLDKRSLIVTYDVSDLLVPGDNSISICAGKGWYTPGAFPVAYGGPLVKARVDVREKSGGWATVLATGPQWRATCSGYYEMGTWRSSNFRGEIMDAREFGSRDTIAVDVVEVDGVASTPMMCVPNVVQEKLSPVSIAELSRESETYARLSKYVEFVESEQNMYIVDMGRDFNGMMEYVLPQLPEGTEVRAYYADNCPPDYLKEHDVLISSGNAGGDRFINRFNHHAFRYVILSGLREKPEPSAVTGYRFRSDLADVTTFECSDEDINAVHDLVKYTLENLSFSGYQVDCPHIERLGYGGDGNSSTISTQTMFDAAPMYLNWLQAWGDAIRDDGGLPHTAPNPYRAGGGPYWCGFVVMAPYRTYLNYGDLRSAQRLYPVMKHWLEYVDSYSVDGLLKTWPNTDYRNWYLGDWLPPVPEDANYPESVDLVNNCSLSQNLSALAELASVLGHEDEAEGYRHRRDVLNRIIHERFYHPEDNTYGSGTEVDMVYPMLVGAVPQNLYGSVRDAFMKRNAEVYSNHIATGLVGVSVLTDWAVRDGEKDFMYGILKQPDFPGYLYMINNGATTTWEEWDTPRSHIHNCYNGVGSWFYQAIGGIAPETPGYRTFAVAPQIPEGMEWASVTKGTPYGTISVKWRKMKNGSVKYDISVPACTEARFVDKNGEESILQAGSHHISVR